MKKTLTAVAAVLVVGIVALVVWKQTKSPASQTNAIGSRTRSVTIAQAGDFYLYAPLYIAADRGFFKDHQIAASIVSTGGDEKTWAAVVSGSAQFGVADPTFIAVASQRGKPGRIIATIVNGVPFWGITKNPKVPLIKSQSDLKGWTVATFPSPSTAYTLQARMFEKGGLKPSIREGGFGALLALVEANQADIALELEPNVSQSLTKGYRIVYGLPDQYGDFTITGLTSTPEYLSANGDTARDVVAALKDAMIFLHEKPKDAADILARRFPEISTDVAVSALDRVLKEGIIPKTPVVDKAAWEKALQLRIDAGDLPKAVDSMQFIDNSFAK
jgi:NitT/TauT family transport system substrate-binding protein